MRGEIQPYPADLTDLSAYGFYAPPEFLRAEMAGIYADLAELAEGLLVLVVRVEMLERTLAGLRMLL